MLLKVTHLPIVAIIMLYESMQARVSKGGSLTVSSTRSASAGLNRNSTITVKKQPQPPFLSSRANTMNSSQHFLDWQDDGEMSSLDLHTSTFQGGQKSQGEVTGVGDLSLEQKVDALTEQVAQLTAIILAQQVNS